MRSITRRCLVAATATSLVVGVAATQFSGADAKQAGYGIGVGIAASRKPAAPAHPAAPKATKTPTTTSTSRAVPSAVPSKTAATTADAAAPATTNPFIATLVTHSDTAADEARAGLKVAMLEFSWRTFEPKQGQYSSSYVYWMKKQMQRYQAAGMKVTLGLGLHYTPSWVLEMAGSRMVDQRGKVSNQADFVFNQTIRDLADSYVKAVDDTVGLKNFWAVRINSGAQSELLYPGSSYWAYSDGAQNGPTKPPTMAVNPNPGWRPGQPASAEQRAAWAKWYVAGLDDVARWQMNTVTSLGFRGYFQFLTPGQGLRPAQFNEAVSKGLPDGLLGRGAAWAVIYGNVKGRTDVTAYVSSMADGSGNDDSCQPSDRDVALDSATASTWSAARWITRLAAANGLTVSGEVPGYPSSSAGRARYADLSSSGLLATAMRQTNSCNFLGFYWAHDDQVRSGVMPLSQLAKYTTASAVTPADVR